MNTNTKPVAKSLHTVTVIVQVARFARMETPIQTKAEALDKALRILGLHGRPDPYGLAAAAIKQMEV